MKLPRNLKPEAACSVDPTRPPLLHPYLDTENQRLLACDGRMLAVIPVDIEPEDIPGHIPIAALKAARTVMAPARSNDPLELKPRNGFVEVNGQGTVDRDPVPGGNFPKVDDVIPQDPTEANGWRPMHVSIDLLYSARQALGMRDGACCTIWYNPDNHLDPFVIEQDKGRGFAIVMPVRSDSGASGPMNLPEQDERDAHVRVLQEALGESQERVALLEEALRMFVDADAGEPVGTEALERVREILAGNQGEGS